jgi:endonuclease/exonuclease/phosphatase family metal-dependent hydrolase
MNIFPPCRALLFALVIFAAAGSLRGQMAPSSPNQLTKSPFKVLSWNIYMLPRFAKITGKRQRAHAIARQLQGAPYQMLVLQEAFLGDARRIIRKGLIQDYPYQLGPANKKFSIKTNSGIWMLSRVPMKYLDEVAFSDCAGFDDCMARKGALLVETEWEGVTVQVLGTHLQAGGPHEIRRRQYDEVRDLLDRHRRPGVPQLICGDMNTSHLDSDNYTRMMETMDAEDGPLLLNELEETEGGYKNDIHKNGVRNKRIIDYIFYRPNGLPARKILRSMPPIRERWSKRHQDLSDHFPVVMELLW